MRKKLYFTLSLFVLCSTFLLTSGCKKIDEEGRKNLSGKVTLNGDILEKGDISFIPMTTSAPVDASRQGGSAPITAGVYSLKKDLGLFPGTYKVQIVAVEITDPKTGKAPSNVEFSTDPGLYKINVLVPEKYNTKSNLTITVVEDKNQTFDFDLKK